MNTLLCKSVPANSMPYTVPEKYVHSCESDSGSQNMLAHFSAYNPLCHMQIKSIKPLTSLPALCTYTYLATSRNII